MKRNINNSIYNRVLNFKKKYSMTIAFRLKKHAEVLENILDNDEEVLYTFCGQKNDDHTVWFSSCVVALTNKRILIGTKRVLWGYFITSITPEMFNDLKVSASLLWGMISIDTAKEKVYISNLDKKSLDEIETNVNRIMQDNKKRLYEN